MDKMSKRAKASHKAMARILHGDFIFFFSITTQHTYSNETVLFGQNYWPYSNEYPIEKEAIHFNPRIQNLDACIYQALKCFNQEKMNVI